MAIADWIAGLSAWLFFFAYRKKIELPHFNAEAVFEDNRLYIGLVIIPVSWILLWIFLGSYHQVYRKSRIQTLYYTFIGVLIGSLGMLFTVIRDDLTLTITSYFQSFVAVLLIHWFCFSLFRTIYLTYTKLLLKRGIVRHIGILISDDVTTVQVEPSFTDFISTFSSSVDISRFLDQKVDTILLFGIKKQTLNKLVPRIIGSADHKEILLDETSFELLDYDYDARPVLQEPYISLKTSPLFEWQKNSKRLIDVFGSLLLIILLGPLMLWLYYRVRESGSGSVIFSQKRIGLKGDLFNIYKFRSMYEDAEQDGPALASINDERCTPFGKWMRRWRLDELPQFFNVIAGDMSLVGPRPERPFYADQLLKHNPRYSLLWQVRPGITSWGQIKYGYAANIDEMLRRFRYDLLYIENTSILLDLRILYYTLIVLLQGKGR